MGLSTLAGFLATSSRVQIPKWGIWYADVAVDGEHELEGVVELKIPDLTLSGCVLAGGPSKGRSGFRLVGGKGGWGRTIPSKSYANDAGVKLSTILGDAAREAGEVLDLSSVPATTAGPAFVRPVGPASLVLEQLVPGAWYVNEAGVTKCGARAPSTLTVKATHGAVDLALGTVELAAESIAGILPGIVVDGLTAVDVLHELTPKGLRSTLWGAQSSGTSRRVSAMQALYEKFDPRRKFRGVTEYRVGSLEGERANLQPVRVSTGMPILNRVPIRPGVAGCKATCTPGARVLVGFVDSDPGRPYVSSHQEAGEDGFLPVVLELDAATLVKLGAGLKPAAALGDLAGGMFPVATTQVKVLV